MTRNPSGRTGTGKKGPPVAPKPNSRTLQESHISDKTNHGDMDLEEFLKSEKNVSDHDQFPDSYVDREHVATVAVQPAPVPAPVVRTENDSTSDSMITNFLNEAIGNIIVIRSRKRKQSERRELRTQVKEENRESGVFDAEDEDSAAAAMPQLNDVLGRTNGKVQQEATLPLQSSKVCKAGIFAPNYSLLQAGSKWQKINTFVKNMNKISKTQKSKTFPINSIIGLGILSYS
ncbi:hypothetical protein DPMN_148900 [Dreissena polymorpha]|uniref:Uncharacterized protein n=1 Tax=Dreissena polymorpha TaxID=45954 RepID=A0A9D4J1Z4_DREPO|nr:hypothetical protein DPMN_148900 [Dreissena polymorpha]